MAVPLLCSTRRDLEGREWPRSPRWPLRAMVNTFQGYHLYSSSAAKRRPGLLYSTLSFGKCNDQLKWCKSLKFCWHDRHPLRMLFCPPLHHLADGEGPQRNLLLVCFHLSNVPGILLPLCPSDCRHLPHLHGRRPLPVHLNSIRSSWVTPTSSYQMLWFSSLAANMYAWLLSTVCLPKLALAVLHVCVHLDSDANSQEVSAPAYFVTATQAWHWIQ